MFNSIEEARAYLPPQDVDTIVYHNVCADGIVSAFAGWRFFKGTQKEIQFVPAAYDDTFSVDKIPGKNILIVDFSYNPDQLKALEAAGKKVLILDHHEGALEMLAVYPHALIVDEQIDDHSGAGLSWEYFYPNQGLPPLFQMVQDRDIWDFALPHTKPFYEALWQFLASFKFDKPFPFQELEKYLDDKTIQAEIARGTPMLMELEKRVQLACNTAKIHTYQGQPLWLVYSKNGNDRSEIGHTLCERGGASLAAIWWENAKDPNKYHVSFRSQKHRKERHKEFNVNIFAQNFGGKGQRGASACVMTTHPESVFLLAPQKGIHNAYQQPTEAMALASSSNNNNNNSLKRNFDMT